MNIFWLDTHPQLCAQYHCDKHVVKMCLEYTQIMSTALHLRGLESPYRPTHQNHPCVKWAAESSENLRILHELAEHLCAEYTHRYLKEHKCQSLVTSMGLQIEGMVLEHSTPPPLCMPDEHKGTHPVESYRDYYRVDKNYMLSYKNREWPEWLASRSAPA